VINNFHNAAYTRVSYNGGRGGIEARPTPQQLAAANERHFDPTPPQLRQRDLAMRNPAQKFAVNHGNPGILATPRPGNFASPHSVRGVSAFNAPHAAAMAPHTAMARSSNGFVHAPRANVAMPGERTHSPAYTQARAHQSIPQRAAMPRAGNERPPMPVRRPPQTYAAPHPGYAPQQMRAMNRSPQPYPQERTPAPPDRRNDHDHGH